MSRLRRWGGRIALFAVWLQLAVAHGHMHPEDVWGPVGHAIVAGHGEAAASADPRDGAGILDDDDDSLCAICLAMGMVASGLHGDAPVLAPPAPVETRHLAATFALALAQPYRPALPRAPPL